MVGGHIIVYPHTRLRIRLDTAAGEAGEKGRVFISAPGATPRATPIFAKTEGHSLQFTIDIGEHLGTQSGTYRLHFATSTRYSALDAPTADSPGVGWVHLPVRYALTPAEIRP